MHTHRHHPWLHIESSNLKLKIILDIINDTSQPLWWSSLGILYERKKNLIEIIVETLSVVEGFAR
jgi:hypothetical protein